MQFTYKIVLKFPKLIQNSRINSNVIQTLEVAPISVSLSVTES